MSYYMYNPDNKTCDGGMCRDPVKPIPNLPQCVANPLDRERLLIKKGHQRPVTNARDPYFRDPASLGPSLGYPSTVAPKKLWSEPKWTNVTVPVALMLILAPGGVLSMLFDVMNGQSLTTARDYSSLRSPLSMFPNLLARVLLFGISWHFIRYKYPVYY